MKFIFVLLAAALIASIEAKNLVKVVRQYNLIEFRNLSAIGNPNFIPINVFPIDVVADYSSGDSDPRVFSTFPLFAAGVPTTMGYVTGDVVEYTPYTFTPGTGCDGLTSVLRVAIDKCNRMWILDSGSPNVCVPQIVIVNLNNNQVVSRYRFQRSMYIDNSLLGTIVVKTEDDLCQNAKAYIADIHAFTLLVYDYGTNSAWKVKNDYFSPDPNQGTFTIDGTSFQLLDGILGLEITKTINAQFPEPTLLFHPLTSATEFAVPLSVLNNRAAFEADPNALADQFRVLGSRGVKTAAQAFDKFGNLYFVIWEPPAIVCWDSSTPYNRDNIKILYRNDTILQFASGVKVVNNDDHEELWMNTNRLQKFWTGTVDPNEINYRVLKAKLKDFRNSAWPSKHDS